jgi:hypothetical protein
MDEMAFLLMGYGVGTLDHNPYGWITILLGFGLIIIRYVQIIRNDKIRLFKNDKKRRVE